MPKFRRKPHVVELEQFLPDEGQIPNAVIVEPGPEGRLGRRYYVLTAHEQPVYLSGGEWIAPEPSGKGQQLVAAENLAKLYDEVGEDESVSPDLALATVDQLWDELAKRPGDKLLVMVDRANDRMDHHRVYYNAGQAGALGLAAYAVERMKMKVAEEDTNGPPTETE